MTDLKNLDKKELNELLASSLASMADSKDKSKLQQLAQDLYTHQIELEMQNRELREAQSILEESRNRYADLYDFAPIGYLTLNSKGYVTEINLTGAKMLGVERTHIIDQPLTRWLTPEYRQTFLNHLNDVFKNKIKVVVELKVKGRKNEATRDVQFESILSLGHDGDTHCLTAMIDITERKQFEAQLILAREEARQRTQELFTEMAERKEVEAQLRRSQKMDALGQFTSGIAHDFNNILGVVMLNLEVLQRKVGENKSLTSWIDLALKNVKRGAELTQKLLKFSSNTAHEMKTTSINKVILETEDLIRQSLTSAIDIKHDLAEDLWLSDIDPGDFSDAIINISINAHDAMPQGGELLIKTRNIHLDSNQAGNPGDYVLLEITDTGTGIEPEDLNRVFEPFYSTKEVGKGTGLGLSMVFGFVTRSGGDISITSEPGHGTTIKIYLPRSKAGVIEELPSDDIDLETFSGSETILVVDDEEDLLVATAEQLQELGYRTLIANTGDAALKLLTSRSDIDLLLSDVVMPGTLNGLELARSALDVKPGLKVLLTSGFADQEIFSIAEGSIEEAMMKQLSSSMLHKPYNLQELALNVRNVLNKKS